MYGLERRVQMTFCGGVFIIYVRGQEKTRFFDHREHVKILHIGHVLIKHFSIFTECEILMENFHMI